MSIFDNPDIEAGECVPQTGIDLQGKVLPGLAGCGSMHDSYLVFDTSLCALYVSAVMWLSADGRP